MQKKKILNTFAKIVFVVFVFTAGLFAHKLPKVIKVPELNDVKIDKNSKNYENKQLAFLFEIYDLVKQNYWDKTTDEQLVNIYILGAEKLSGKKTEIKNKDKENLEKILTNTLREIKGESKKNEFTVQLSDIVLANLQPFGRSRLYSQKDETELKNRVENINPEVDQYQILDVQKDSSLEEIKQAYKEKTKELEKDSSFEAKEKLAQLDKTFEILSDEKNRQIYNKSGAEPTMENRLLSPNIFYIHIKQFSPTTIEELLNVTQKVDQGDVLDTLILDLRDNVGGAIDGLPYFLGPFIGNDQYAYQFFHQGNREDFKTKIGWLPSLIRYKKVIVLINENTQSSAEVMATVLKKYNVGILVGTTTKGWGTVEKVFSLSNQIDEKTKYSVFLVHSLVLREDNQPIEGKGVDPIINIKDKNWKNMLLKHINSTVLIQKLSEIFN